MDEMWVRLVSFLEALAPDTFHRALSLCVFICRWFDVRSCRRSDSQPSVVLQKKIPRLPPEHEHLKQLQCFEFFKVSLVGAPSRAVLMGTSAAVVCLYPGVLINSSTAATLTAGSRNVTMWLCSSEERNADAPSLNHTKHGYLRRIKCHLCVYVPFVIPDDTHTHPGWGVCTLTYVCVSSRVTRLWLNLYHWETNKQMFGLWIQTEQRDSG